MSEAPASPAADAGFEAAAVLAHWRAAGLAAAHPVRFRLLEAMCERLQTRPPAARTLLQARLRQAMAAYWRAATRAGTAPAADAATGALPGARLGPGPLAGLLAHAARQSAGAAPADPADASPRATPAAAGPLPGAEASPELKALRWFRGTWSRLSADQRLNQSLAQVPDNAGPLNSQQLVHRSLALMRALSPDYLQHFVAQVDALMWLDHVNGGEIPTGRAESPPRRPGRGRRHGVG
ncbi:DUF2894 domain-containing protein [Aquincola tertiaricarbonis]|uniref:DUF2894 domain-containing protein n=1 Tax=Aquincola tertiaricarbonis TaxID=391953 RepID=UPI00069673CA|nr:DUF2894 domain-containing protein [Aquincola tertiaricarbonis]